MENKIEQLMQTALQKIKESINSNTIIGDPVTVNGKTIVPITKATFGLCAGGGEYSGTDKQVKQTKEFPFAGGTGAGVNVQPIGFLCTENGKTKFIKVDALSPLEKLVENLPKIAEAVSSAIKENKNENN